MRRTLVEQHRLTNKFNHIHSWVGHGPMRVTYPTVTLAEYWWHTKVGDEAELFSHLLFTLTSWTIPFWAISLPIIHHHIFRDSFFCTLAEINQQKQKLPTMEYCYKTFESFSTVLWFVSSLVLFFILHRTLTRKISITYSANVIKVGSISIMGSSMEADFINAFNTMPI